VSGVVIAETLRRHFKNVGYVAYAIVLVMAGLFIAQFERPGSVWPGLVTLLAIITGCAPIGPEFSSGTLQLILVKPINRAVYLLSRVAGVVLAVWAGALAAALAELAGRGFSDFTPIATVLVHSMADVLLIVSLLALVGSFTRAYFNVAIYFGTHIFLDVLTGIGARKFPQEVTRALSAILQNVFPDAPPRFSPEWLLLVTCNAAIALVLACLIFRKREVPYGAE
jgi:ABC-type transport system involved in multi-copper enzyme maturation permease subunit